MSRTVKRIWGVVFALTIALATVLSGVPSASVVRAESGAYMHIFYKDTSGKLQAVWKKAFTGKTEKSTVIVTKEEMPKFDKDAKLDAIDDLNPTGLIAIIYDESRDGKYGDKAPDDLSAYYKALKKTDTYQVTPFVDNEWFFIDPAGGSSYGGSIMINTVKSDFKVIFDNNEGNQGERANPYSGIKTDCYIILVNNGEFTSEFYLSSDAGYEGQSVTDDHEGTVTVSTYTRNSFYFDIDRTDVLNGEFALVINDKPYRPDGGNRVWLKDIPEASEYIVGVAKVDPQKSQSISLTSPKKTTVSYKAADLKKKAASFTIKASAKTTVKYKVASSPKGASKYITLSKKSGKSTKVTLKKGAPKGTYKIKISAGESFDYSAAKAKTITIKVK